jgi:hypothetical protein
VGPRAILDMVVKRKIPSPCQESNPRTPIIQPAAIKTGDEVKCLKIRICKTKLILQLFSNVCKIWSLSLSLFEGRM